MMGIIVAAAGALLIALIMLVIPTSRRAPAIEDTEAFMAAETGVDDAVEPIAGTTLVGGAAAAPEADPGAADTQGAEEPTDDELEPVSAPIPAPLARRETDAEPGRPSSAGATALADPPATAPPHPATGDPAPDLLGALGPVLVSTPASAPAAAAQVASTPAPAADPEEPAGRADTVSGWTADGAAPSAGWPTPDVPPAADLPEEDVLGGTLDLITLGVGAVIAVAAVVYIRRRRRS